MECTEKGLYTLCSKKLLELTSKKYRAFSPSIIPTVLILEIFRINIYNKKKMLKTNFTTKILHFILKIRQIMISSNIKIKLFFYLGKKDLHLINVLMDRNFCDML